MIMDFGHQAPCDSLPKPGQLREMEKTYPPRPPRCPAHGLAQIDHVVGNKVAAAYDRAKRIELRRELVRWYETTLIAARDGAEVVSIADRQGGA